MEQIFAPAASAASAGHYKDGLEERCYLKKNESEVIVAISLCLF